MDSDLEFAEDEGMQAFERVMETFGRPEVAPWLRTMTLVSHDHFGNAGVVEWCVGPLADAPVPFARLRTLTFRGGPISETDADDFSGVFYKSVSDRRNYDETLAGRMLDRMPVLEELVIPDPPPESFFQRSPHPLKRLTLRDADLRDVVSGLAGAVCFPHLEYLEIWESDRTDVHPRLSPSKYLRLFDSSAYPALRTVRLRQVDHNVTADRLRDTRLERNLTTLDVTHAKSWYGEPILGAPSEEG